MSARDTDDLRCRRLVSAVRDRLGDPDAFACAWIDSETLIGVAFVGGRARFTTLPIDDDEAAVDALVAWCEKLLATR